jgi:CBS-domain-containing membrane protein
MKEPLLWIEDEDIRAALKDMQTYLDITEEDLKRIFQLALEHAKRRLKKRILVKDVMTKNVIAVKKDTKVSELIEILTKNRISGVPVVDEENRVVGIVSEADLLFTTNTGKIRGLRDFLKRLIGEGYSTLATPLPGDLKVEDIMTSPVITASPDMDIEEASKILSEKRIKRLPVVDENGKLIGIITRHDLVSAIGYEA